MSVLPLISSATLALPSTVRREFNIVRDKLDFQITFSFRQPLTLARTLCYEQWWTIRERVILMHWHLLLCFCLFFDCRSWQWFDTVKWNDYSREDNEKIEDAFRRQKLKFTLYMRGVPDSYSMNLQDFTQTNNRTGYVRPIRRSADTGRILVPGVIVRYTLQSPAPQYIRRWSYSSAYSGRMVDFDHLTCLQLDSASIEEAPFVFLNRGAFASSVGVYRVDIAKMILENLETGVAFQVVRGPVIMPPASGPSLYDFVDDNEDLGVDSDAIAKVRAACPRVQLIRDFQHPMAQQRCEICLANLITADLTPPESQSTDFVPSIEFKPPVDSDNFE
jgi:hypothetical protein